MLPARFEKYSNKQTILVLGSIAFFLGAGLLAILTLNQPADSTTVTQLTASSLEESFSEPLSLAQAGNYDTAWASHGFLMLDVRPAASYAKGHIAGSISAPADQLQYAMVNPDDQIIVYSQDQQELERAMVVLKYRNVHKIYLLSESFDTLTAQGYDITKP